MKTLVSEGELKNAVTNYSKEVGNGVKTVVIDLVKYAKAVQASRRESGKAMVIQLQPVKESVRHEEFYWFSCVTDAVNDIKYGDIVTVHPDDQIVWKRQAIRVTDTFNLNNLEDCKKWCLVRLWPKVVGSPFNSGYETPVFKVFDPDEDAETRQGLMDAKRQALDRSQELSGEEFVAMMNVLNIPVDDGMSIKRIRMLIDDYADKFPMDFNNKYDDERKDRLATFNAAIRLNIIKYNTDIGYVLHGKSIGSTEVLALKWLLDNPDAHRELVDQIAGEDKLVKRILVDSTTENKYIYPITIKKLIRDGRLPEGWNNGDVLPDGFDWTDVPHKRK
jgi:hypothetical protein